MKWFIVVTALLISQQHLVLRFFFFGGMASPELPAATLLILRWLFIAFFLLAILAFLADIISLCLWLAQKSGLPSAPSFSAAKRAVFLPMLALCLAAYGEFSAMRVPEARTEEAFIDRLPPALDGFTLAHVTDLHVSALLRGERTRAVVDKVLALDADIILFTGDMVDGAPADREADAAPLKDLRARFGVFACAGNHEYYANFAAWMREFDRLGLTVLGNSHRVLSVRGAPVVVAGVTDIASSRYGLPGPDSEAALSGAPEGALTILLAHRPGSAPENALLGVDLQLSGHTHGGQILGLSQIVKYFNGGFVSGWYSLDRGAAKNSGQMRLYVSSGAGLWNGFPVRLGVPSEITRIVLRAPRPAPER